MVQSHAISPNDRRALANVARDLHDQFSGVFGIETIEALVLDSYAKRADTATVTRWLVVGAERFAKERLEALVHGQQPTEEKVPRRLIPLHAQRWALADGPRLVHQSRRRPRSGMVGGFRA